MTEKAKRDDSGLADEMLQQLLVGIPLLRMMGLVRSEESTKDDAEKDGREVDGICLCQTSRQTLEVWLCRWLQVH